MLRPKERQEVHRRPDDFRKKSAGLLYYPSSLEAPRSNPETRRSSRADRRSQVTGHNGKYNDNPLI
jgi:hypothetical protein